MKEMLLKKAKKLSNESNHEHYKHAVLIVKGGNIIASGRNWNKKHAEVNAIGRHDPSRLKGSTLYSLRFNKGGLANSRPCNDCMYHIKKAQIKTIAFFDTDESMNDYELTYLPVFNG